MSRSSRRTSIFKVTTRDSESQRAVEKELSEEFHQNLRLLAYFQPYSDTLNAMISKVSNRLNRFRSGFLLQTFLSNTCLFLGNVQ